AVSVAVHVGGDLERVGSRAAAVRIARRGRGSRVAGIEQQVLQGVQAAGADAERLDPLLVDWFRSAEHVFDRCRARGPEYGALKGVAANERAGAERVGLLPGQRGALESR